MVTISTQTDGLRLLSNLRHFFASAAQQVYDDWDEEEMGGGGICDQVSSEIQGVIVSNIGEAEVDEGSPEGDDHSWTVVSLFGKDFGVDIPAGVYEVGAGYNWKKIPGVTFSPADVCIWAF